MRDGTSQCAYSLGTEFTKTLRSDGLLSRLGLLGFVLMCAAGCAGKGWTNPHEPAFDGSVESVDLRERRLTLAPLKAGASVVFAWDGNSRFWANGLRIDPTFLQARDIVRVHYWDSTGQQTIQHLYLQTHRIVH